MRFALVVIVVLLAVVAAFAVQNPGIITVHFLQYTGNTSLLVVIVAAFGVGVLVGLLVSIPGTMRRGRRIRELERELSALRRKPTDGPPPVAP